MIAAYRFESTRKDTKTLCIDNACLYTHGNKLGNTCNNVTVNIFLCKTYEKCFDNLSKSVVSKVASM